MCYEEGEDENIEREAKPSAPRSVWRKLYLNKTDVNLDIAIRVYVFKYNTSHFPPLMIARKTFGLD